MKLENKLIISQYRFVACVAFACVIHVLGFTTIHFSDHRKVAKYQESIDIQLMSPSLEPRPTSFKSKPTTHHKLSLASMSSHAKTSKMIPADHKRTISENDYEPQDAPYLARWQAYVEEIGTAHLEKSAFDSKFKGELSLMVAINKDGSIHRINLKKSSGNKFLDKTAIQIVLNAAPFEPLPSEVSKGIEVLEIIRTWQFNSDYRRNA